MFTCGVGVGMWLRGIVFFLRVCSFSYIPLLVYRGESIESVSLGFLVGCVLDVHVHCSESF